MKYLMIITLLMTSFTSFSQEKQVYLYVIFHDDNSNDERFRTKMFDMASCLKSLEKGRFPSPSHVGGDFEVVVAAWCGGDIHREHNFSWLNSNRRFVEADK